MDVYLRHRTWLGQTQSMEVTILDINKQPIGFWRVETKWVKDYLNGNITRQKPSEKVLRTLEANQPNDTSEGQTSEESETGQEDTGTGSRDTSVLVVIEVTDADTVDIRYKNGSTNILRLIGVNAPEITGENEASEFEGVPDTEKRRVVPYGNGDIKPAGTRATLS